MTAKTAVPLEFRVFFSLLKQNRMGSEADARDELLQKIYYDPKTGYSNTLELYRRAKKKSKSITISYVKA